MSDTITGRIFDCSTQGWIADVILGGEYASQTYVDGSLSTLNASVNTALGLKTDFTYDVKQDASIGLKTDFTYDVKQDASIGLKTDFTYDVKQDASIGLKTDFTYDVKQDASIELKTDFTYDVKQDTSMLSYTTNASVASAGFANNASLGLYVQKAGDIMTGNLSIANNVNNYYSLDVSGKSEGYNQARIGNVVIGDWHTAAGYDNYAMFKHRKLDGISNYAFIQDYSGQTYFNATTILSLGIGANAKVRLDSTTFYPPTTNTIDLGYKAQRYKTLYVHSIEASSNILVYGKVGIGVNPSTNLDVSGNLHTTGAAVIDGSLVLKNTGIYGLLTPISSSDAVNKYYVDSSLGTYATNASISTAAFASDASLGLYVQKAGDTITGVLQVNSSIGINKIPSYTLDVSGNFHTTGANFMDGSLRVNGFSYFYNSVGLGKVPVASYYLDSAGDINIPINAAYRTATNQVLMQTTAGLKFGWVNHTYFIATGLLSAELVANYITALTCTSSGRVGIRTQNPTYTLDVSGNLHTSGAAVIDGSIKTSNNIIIDSSNKIFTILNGLANPTEIAKNYIKIGQDSGNGYGYIDSNGNTGLTFRWMSTSSTTGVAMAATDFIPIANQSFGLGQPTFKWKRFFTSNITDTSTVVGVGTQNPSTFFHVVGTTIIDGSISLKNQRILGLGSPSDSSDAVNKYYADASFNIKLFTVDNSIVSLINTGQDLQLSSIELQENGGVMTLTDMSVTSTEPSGTIESYSFNMDGCTAFRIEGVADACVGVSQKYIVATVDYFYFGEPSADDSWRFYTDASKNLVFQRRITGVWTNKLMLV